MTKDEAEKAAKEMVYSLPLEFKQVVSEKDVSAYLVLLTTALLKLEKGLKDGAKKRLTGKYRTSPADLAKKCKTPKEIEVAIVNERLCWESEVEHCEAKDKYVKTLEKNINGLEATISAKQNTIAELKYVIKEEVAESKYLKAKLEESKAVEAWAKRDYEALEGKIAELQIDNALKQRALNKYPINKEINDALKIKLEEAEKQIFVGSPSLKLYAKQKEKITNLEKEIKKLKSS